MSMLCALHAIEVQYGHGRTQERQEKSVLSIAMGC